RLLGRWTDVAQGRQGRDAHLRSGEGLDQAGYRLLGLRADRPQGHRRGASDVLFLILECLGQGRDRWPGIGAQRGEGQRRRLPDPLVLVTQGLSQRGGGLFVLGTDLRQGEDSLPALGGVGVFQTGLQFTSRFLRNGLADDQRRSRKGQPEGQTDQDE